MSNREKAQELYLSGYNCSQAVFGAFAQDLGVDFEDAMRIASGFGGGIGRLRETCGALTGMLMAYGVKEGNIDGADAAGKAATYEVCERLADEFERRTGAMLCKNLIGVNRGDKTTPEDAARHKKMCTEFVGCAADILGDYFKK